MPKDKTGRASKRCRSYKPYKDRHGKDLLCMENLAKLKDWEDATCPICMEPPHNAVLLICSSHDKGCHPYMCNSSYRHSNCLDQYKKAHAVSQEANGSRPHPGTSNSAILINGEASQGVTSGEDAELPQGSMPRKNDMSPLVCPLCRGTVTCWIVVDAARSALNQRARACSHESCTFTGSYEELRVHARQEHPSARPCEVDPARQQHWRQLEDEHGLADILSSILSALPGATVVGDYVIEDEDGFVGDVFSGFNDHFLTGSLLFDILEPAASIEETAMRLHARDLYRRYNRAAEARQISWGENMHRLSRDGIVASNGITSSSGTRDLYTRHNGAAEARQVLWNENIHLSRRDGIAGSNGITSSPGAGMRLGTRQALWGENTNQFRSNSILGSRANYDNTRYQLPGPAFRSARGHHRF